MDAVIEELINKFFNKYGIKKNRIYREYKYDKSHVELRKKELEKLQSVGIECDCINVINNEHGEEEMIYWYEYHYPKIDDTKLIDLLFIAIKYGFYFKNDITNRDDLKFMVINFLSQIDADGICEVFS